MEALEEAYSLVDPKHGTPFEKSRTAFISISLKNGSITLSAFLARALGIVDGDRIAFINNKTNPLKWLICKTRQRQGTKQVKIVKAVYKVNSTKWVKEIGSAFRFNPEYKQLIRLYVNMEDYLTLGNFDNVKAMQLFDIPHQREDFATEQEKQDYIKYLTENPYIIKVVKKDELNNS